MTVTTVYPTAAGDGRVYSASTIYADAREGSGTATLSPSTTTTVISAGQDVAAGTYTCYEYFAPFDTSAIADADIVSAVTLELWSTTDASTTDFTVEVRAYDWGSTFGSNDYVPGSAISGNPLMATRSSVGITTGAYNTFTSESAFLTAPNMKTGTVKLLFCSDRHRAGTTPPDSERVAFSSADTSGTTQDPKLTITHAGSGTTIAVGQATETDTANPITPAVSLTVGQATETDTAQVITPAVALAVGQAAETDTAQPVTVARAVQVGQASETDTATAITPGLALGVGLAAETDTAQVITPGVPPAALPDQMRVSVTETGYRLTITETGYRMEVDVQEFTLGDVGAVLTGHVKDLAGALVDLTGHTLHINISRLGASVLTVQATLANQTTDRGGWSYTMVSGNLSGLPGKWSFEQVVDQATTPHTIKKDTAGQLLYFVVLAQIA